MNYFLILLSLFFSTATFSQTHIANTSHEVEYTKYTTCVLSTVLYNEDDVNSLKQELIGWDTKVINVIYNVQQKKLTIIYNKEFNQIEFTEVLGKYNMSKKSIISCN